MEEGDVTDAEESPAQMPGVVKEFPSEQNSGRVHGDEASQSVLGGDGEHRQEDDGQLRVGILRANDAGQAQDRACGLRKIDCCASFESVWDPLWVCVSV